MEKLNTTDTTPIEITGARTFTNETKEGLMPLNIYNTTERKSYAPTDEEKAVIGHVRERFQQMRAKRNMVDKKWAIYYKQFEAILIPYSDNGRSKANVNLEQSVIEMSIAEFRKKKPSPIIMSKGGVDPVKDRIAQKVWEQDHKDNKRMSEYKTDDYRCGIIGTSVMYSGYEENSRIVYDMTPTVDEEGVMKWKKKEIRQGKINLKSIDIRDFYPDDRVSKWEEAIDCIWITRMPYESFRALANVNGYKNIDCVDTVNPRKENFTFRVKDEVFSEKVVEIKNYYNKQSDRHIMIANDAVVIRDTPILHPKKELPFTMRQFYANPDSLWGRGIPEILTSIKSEVNTLKEALMEGVKRSTNEIIAVGGDLDFDGQEFNFNNTILRFTGTFRDNFQQLTGTAPSEATFKYLEWLYREVAIATGIDVMAIIDSSGGTAYQTAVKEGIGAKRMNNVIENRDEAYEIIFRLHWANLQFFYPTLLAEYINGEEVDQTDEEIQKFNTIRLEKEKLVEEDGELNIIESKIDTMFHLNPEYIRGDFNITIYTNYNEPTLEQTRRDAMNAGIAALAQFAQVSQMLPELENSKNEIITEISRQYHIPFDLDKNSISNKLQEGKDQILQATQRLMNGINGSQLGARMGGGMGGGMGGLEGMQQQVMQGMEGANQPVPVPEPTGAQFGQ